MHSLVNPQLLSVAVAISQRKLRQKCPQLIPLSLPFLFPLSLSLALPKTIKCNSSKFAAATFWLSFWLTHRTKWGGGLYTPERKCLHNAKCRHAHRICCHWHPHPSPESQGTQLQPSTPRNSSHCTIINVRTNQADAVKYDEGHVPAASVLSFSLSLLLDLYA